MAKVTKDGIDLEIGVIEKDAIDRMLEKIPIDELVRDYLGDTKAERLNELYEELEKLNEATIDRVLKATPVEVKTELTKCPECGKKLNMDATHLYSITQDDGGKFHRSDGEASYRCDNCGTFLHISQIEDALKQVDEL